MKKNIENKPEITRKDAILIALGTYLILSPQKAEALCTGF